MKKKQLAILTMAALLMAVPANVSVFGAENTKEESTESTVLEDGVYSAVFDTDSGMFHVNESLDGRGTLTVKDGKMTIHVSLASKGILNLFPGKAEYSKKEGAELLEPRTDKVTYNDGYEEEVYGFGAYKSSTGEIKQLKRNNWQYLLWQHCLWQCLPMFLFLEQKIQKRKVPKVQF